MSFDQFILEGTKYSSKELVGYSFMGALYYVPMAIALAVLCSSVTYIVKTHKGRTTT